MAVIYLDTSAAIKLFPGRLRSLDALHCAAALSLGSAVSAFVAYDKRLIECAHALSLPVRSPAEQ